MKLLRKVLVSAMVLTMSAILVAGLWAQKTDEKQQGGAEKKANPTLENLQKAFNGESNAHARYLAFAKKADEEGYAGAASLFRAAANAEETHAKRFSETIKKMGAEPKAEVKEPEVKSTKENLQAALAGESEERDKMYPEFMKAAREAGDKAAVRVFNFAKSAEGDHAKFYKEAVDNLDSWKAKKDFFVCQECGRTVTEMPTTKCPVCGEPPSFYKKVA